MTWIRGQRQTDALLFVIEDRVVFGDEHVAENNGIPSGSDRVETGKTRRRAITLN